MASSLSDAGPSAAPSSGPDDGASAHPRRGLGCRHMLRGRRARRAQAMAQATVAVAVEAVVPRMVAAGARAGLRRSRRPLRPVGRLARRIPTAVGRLPSTPADDALLALTRSANHSWLWLATASVL